MIEIITCEQNTDEWRRARAGIVTASTFSTVLAKGKGGGESLTRQKLLYRLAGEIITGEAAETFSNGAMERGHAMEEEARDLYAFINDVEPELVGFIRNGRKGASPDALTGVSGLLEIKTHKPEILIPMIFKDEFPPEHIAQTQGQLWVCEREWVDLICYWPGMPPFVKRAVRDDDYIKTLDSAVEQFNSELDAIVERLRSYGCQTPVAPPAQPELPASVADLASMNAKHNQALNPDVREVTGPIRYLKYAEKALDLAQSTEEISALVARMEDSVRTAHVVKDAVERNRARVSQ
jgi:hypothetical protein